MGADPGRTGLLGQRAFSSQWLGLPLGSQTPLCLAPGLALLRLLLGLP